jgi:uncharacterized protein (DUF58 family)
MPQDVTAILKRVRQLEILAKRLVDQLLAGAYRSVFRGRGIEFESVREYQPGDDIRAIDWNVTARMDRPFVKQTHEERELTVLLMVDISASGAFGSVRRSKLEMVVELAALLMFSAIRNNDRVGLITFCDRVYDYYRPARGRPQMLQLIRHLVALEPVPGATSLEAPLEFITRVVKRRSVAFLFSDFLAPPGQRPARGRSASADDTAVTSPFGWPARRALGICNKRHDLVAVTVADPREQMLPDVGLLSLRDAETSRVVEVDTRHPHIRKEFQSRAARRSQELSRQLRRLGIDELAIRTDEECLAGLRRFFRARKRRFRRHERRAST